MMKSSSLKMKMKRKEKMCFDDIPVYFPKKKTSSVNEKV